MVGAKQIERSVDLAHTIVIEVGDRCRSAARAARRRRGRADDDTVRPGNSES